MCSLDTLAFPSFPWSKIRFVVTLMTLPTYPLPLVLRDLAFYSSFCRVLWLCGFTGKCPVSPALEGGVKGHNIKGKYLTGKPRPLGRGASLKRFVN